MVKIQSNTDRSFLMDGVPYQKGAYEISPLSNETQIKIVRVGSDTVVKEAPLSQWVDGADASFVDFQAFVTYTEPFFFRSVSGGGGVSGLLTERISNQKTATEGTTEQAFQTYLTLVQTKTLVATDKYLLTVGVGTSMASTIHSVQLRLLNWNVVIGLPYRVENKDLLDNRIETFIFEIFPDPLELEGWDLKLQYASTGGANPAEIHYALLQLQKINP